MAEPKLSHVDSKGRARMVDVGDKKVSDRVAVARAVVRMEPGTVEAILEGNAPKGDVFSVARIAGIMAAKRTDELIPLAHPLMASHIDVDIEADEGGVVQITSSVRTSGQTGVEMEALVASSVAALTVYDMVKAVERGVTIEKVELISKSGGNNDWSKQ